MFLWGTQCLKAGKKLLPCPWCLLSVCFYTFNVFVQQKFQNTVLWMYRKRRFSSKASKLINIKESSLYQNFVLYVVHDLWSHFSPKNCSHFCHFWTWPLHTFFVKDLLSVSKIGNVDDDITLDDFSAGLPTTYFRSDTHMLNISIVTQILWARHYPQQWQPKLYPALSTPCRGRQVQTRGVM